MVRTLENNIELFSGEFDHEGNHVVAKDGKIEEVTAIVEEPKTDENDVTEGTTVSDTHVDGGANAEVQAELAEVKTELSAVKESLAAVLKGLEQFSSMSKEIEGINERMALQNLAFKQQNPVTETVEKAEPVKVDRLTILSKTKNIFKAY
jgi:hypothetical protein